MEAPEAKDHEMPIQSRMTYEIIYELAYQKLGVHLDDDNRAIFIDPIWAALELSQDVNGDALFTDEMIDRLIGAIEIIALGRTFEARNLRP